MGNLAEVEAVLNNPHSFLLRHCYNFNYYLSDHESMRDNCVSLT